MLAAAQHHHTARTHTHSPLGDSADGLRRLAPQSPRLGGDRAPTPRRRRRDLLRQLGVLELLRYILDPGAGIHVWEERSRGEGERSEERAQEIK